MPHKHRSGRRRSFSQPAIAVAAACDDCAHLIGNPEPGEHGIRMAIIHIGCLPELEAEGWITTRQNGPHEPPDCCCPHYHAAYWEGGHDSSCCGIGNDDGDGAQAK